MNSPSPELYELGGQFTARERFQLFSGETNLSLKFRRLWFSPKTPLQTIITQATFVTDDPEKLLTIGRTFLAEHGDNRFLSDDELVHTIIPAAIQHTKNTRGYHDASLMGEKIYNRKSPHFVVLFQLLDHETRTAQQILDVVHGWRDNPQSAAAWEWVLGNSAKYSLAAIKRQLEDSVRPGENDTAPLVERLKKGVYRLIPEKRRRVEWWLCCLEIYLDWNYSCEKTSMKLPRVGYRFFHYHEYDSATGKYLKSQYADEYDQLLMVHPYTNDAFYQSHAQFKQGRFDSYNPDHIKVGEEAFFHGGASRHRITSQPKARRIAAKPSSGRQEARRPDRYS